MGRFKNLMEIFALLEKSNCRKCNEPTCLAFAAAVFKGQKKLEECPRLAPETLARYADADTGTAKPDSTADEAELALAAMRQKIAAMDLEARAEPLGGRWAGGRLALKIMGKDFGIDAQGGMHADIHINPWVAIPVFDYVLTGAPAEITGEWVPFRELKGGRERNGLFGQMCEKPMKRIADTHPDFFEDLIRLFNGKPVEKHYQSDISLVLHPLPKVPILICYWKPEDGLESSLNIFFDRSLEKNLDIGSVYMLITGIGRMFEKLFLRHGIDPDAGL